MTRREARRTPARGWRRAQVVALLLVVIAAAAVRVWRLGWGLDEHIIFPDERGWMERIAPLHRLDPAAFLEVRELLYPTLYGYLAGVAARLGSALGLVARPDTPGTPGSFDALRVARSVSVAASLVSVTVVAWLGARAYGAAWIGVAAAALLAAAPLDVMQVHYASVDTTLTCWMSLTLLASWWLRQTGSGWAALAAGLATGLAFATKYTGAAFGAAALWAVLERAVADRAPRTALRLGVPVLLGAAAGAVAGCPPCVLRTDLLHAAFTHHRLMVDLGGFDNNRLSPSIGWWGRPWLHQIVAVFPYGLGLPTALLALAGVAVAAWRRAPGDRLLLAAMAPYFAYMGASTVVFPRYMQPLFPPLALLAAGALAAVPWRRAATACAVVAAGWGFAVSLSQVPRFSWQQQRQVVAWIGEHAGALPREERKVIVPAYVNYFQVHGLLHAAQLTPVNVLGGDWFTEPAPFFLLPEWYAIAIRRDRRDPRLVEDLQRLESGAAGYVPVFRIAIPHHLQWRLDTALDPAYAIELWQGSLGFTVYARRGTPGVTTD